MMLLKVRLYGDPCLRKKSTPVTKIGPAERIFIEALFKTMDAHKGIGLAAPQVGVNEQIFVIDTGKEAMAVINPKILKREGQDKLDEGCLSIPRLSVMVERSKSIEVSYTAPDNQLVRRTLTGLAAKAFLHEYDHLQGILIVDYLPSAQKKQVLSQIIDGVYTGQDLTDESKHARKV